MVSRQGTGTRTVRGRAVTHKLQAGANWTPGGSREGRWMGLWNLDSSLRPARVTESFGLDR